MQNILGCYGGGGGGLDLAWRKCWLARVRRQPGKRLAQAGWQAWKKKVVGDARRRGQSGLASVWELSPNPPAGNLRTQNRLPTRLPEASQENHREDWLTYSTASFSIKHHQQQQGARKNFSSEERSQAPNSMKLQFDQTKIVICVRNNLKAEAKKWKTTNCEGDIWKAKLCEVSPKLEAGLDNGDHWTLKLNPLDFQVSPPPLITTAFPCWENLRNHKLPENPSLCIFWFTKMQRSKLCSQKQAAFAKLVAVKSQQRDAGLGKLRVVWEVLESSKRFGRGLKAERGDWKRLCLRHLPDRPGGSSF